MADRIITATACCLSALIYVAVLVWRPARHKEFAQSAWLILISIFTASSAGTFIVTFVNCNTAGCVDRHHGLCVYNNLYGPMICLVGLLFLCVLEYLRCTFLEKRRGRVRLTEAAFHLSLVANLVSAMFFISSLRWIFALKGGVELIEGASPEQVQALYASEITSNYFRALYSSCAGLFFGALIGIGSVVGTIRDRTRSPGEA